MGNTRETTVRETIKQVAALASEEVADNVEWLTGLASRFPTNRSVERFRDLLTKIATASEYDPGEADLDDEQHVRGPSLTLGEVRLARRLLR